MKKAILNKYAELLVKRGVNLQKGQTLVVSAAVDQEPLVTEVVKWGYNVGAKEVVVEWSSDAIYKIGLKHKSLKTLRAGITHSAGFLMKRPHCRKENTPL